MFKCMCGKTYKTEKGHLKHISSCKYNNIDLKKIYRLGLIIHENNKFLFHVHFGKINKLKKEGNYTKSEAEEILLKENIFKYRKSLWDILEIWQDELLPSEYRSFTEWAFKTYKDITLLSLKNTLGNRKVIYRFNLENTNKMIKKRIDDSLLYIHNNKTFYNDFDFVDVLITGNISMYYVLFNDWLASEWFGRLEIDLQHELEYYVSIASKIIIDRLSHDEFDELQQLANSDTPIIYEM